MTDDTDAKKKAFQQWLNQGAPAQPVPTTPGGGPAADPPQRPVLETAKDWGRTALEQGWAGVQGAGKAIVRDVNPQGGLLVSTEAAKRARDWAASEDQEHPTADWLGGQAAELAPAAMLPEMELYPAAARTLNAAKQLRYLPALQKAIPKPAAQAADWLWNVPGRGAVGGAIGGKDPQEGAATGAGGAVAANLALGTLHRSLPVLAAIWALAGGHHPYWAYHLARHAIDPLARAARQVTPGVSGGAAAKAEDEMGQ